MVRLIIKGAPEYILPMCIKYMDLNGLPQQLDEGSRKKILDTEITEKLC